MPDNNERVDAHIDPVADAATADTQPSEPIQSPAEDVSGHDDSQPTSNTPDDSSATGDIDLAEYQRLKREEGKLKQTQKEREQLERQKKALQEWILADPERTKAALIEQEGYTKEQAEQLVNQAKASGRWATNNQQPAATNQSQFDPVQIAREAARAEVQQQAYVQKFFSLFPDLKPETAKNQDEAEQRYNTALSVNNLAAAYKSVSPDLTDDEALTQAYKFVTKKSDDEIAQAREAGKLEGLLLANGQKAATSTAPVASQGTRGQPQLTDAERKIADEGIARGLFKDYAEYAKYKEADGDF